MACVFKCGTSEAKLSIWQKFDLVEEAEENMIYVVLVAENSIKVGFIVQRFHGLNFFVNKITSSLEAPT